MNGRGIIREVGFMRIRERKRLLSLLLIHNKTRNSGMERTH